jgi:hypothetical protein
MPVPDDGDLGEFEGKRVAAIKVVINNAGDGLSRAMDIDPRLLEIHDRAYVLLRVDTTKVRFEPHKPDKGEEDLDELDRVQILRAEGAMIVPPDAGIDTMITRVQERERERREAQRGIMRLPGTGAEEGEPRPAKRAGKRASTRGRPRAS